VTDLLLRIGILALASLLTVGIVWYGRRYVAGRRRLALAAVPTSLLDGSAHFAQQRTGVAPVHILAFSSADCSQCHQFQEPSLQRVIEARPHKVSFEEIDAPSSPELTERYQVLTVPTTVILDAAGRVQAINYGFANTQRLLEQVDSTLATESIA
jgi:hypothetical protein